MNSDGRNQRCCFCMDVHKFTLIDGVEGAEACQAAPDYMIKPSSMTPRGPCTWCGESGDINTGDWFLAHDEKRCPIKKKEIRRSPRQIVRAKRVREDNLEMEMCSKINQVLRAVVDDVRGRWMSKTFPAKGRAEAMKEEIEKAVRQTLAVMPDYRYCEICVYCSSPNHRTRECKTKKHLSQQFGKIGCMQCGSDATLSHGGVSQCPRCPKDGHKTLAMQIAVCANVQIRAAQRTAQDKMADLTELRDLGKPKNEQKPVWVHTLIRKGLRESSSLSQQEREQLQDWTKNDPQPIRDLAKTIEPSMEIDGPGQEIGERKNDEVTAEERGLSGTMALCKWRMIRHYGKWEELSGGRLRRDDALKRAPCKGCGTPNAICDMATQTCFRCDPEHTREERDVKRKRQPSPSQRKPRAASPHSSQVRKSEVSKVDGKDVDSARSSKETTKEKSVSITRPRGRSVPARRSNTNQATDESMRKPDRATSSSARFGSAASRPHRPMEGAEPSLTGTLCSECGRMPVS
jgi:hypothetical protein